MVLTFEFVGKIFKGNYWEGIEGYSDNDNNEWWGGGEGR